MKAIPTKALPLLIVLALGATPAFAQDHVIQKPVGQQKTTTTTTTKPKTNTSKSSRTGNNTTVSNPTGYINGHGYVDLGLSVKWATCNVGASSPSDYGNYYAWGETSTKSEYTEENSKTYGRSMGSIAGDPQYDAACANWGGTWRLPTASEIDELVNKCTRTWTTQGGHKGYKFTGPNGNSIFVPAAGWRDGSSLDGAGESGDYWSATPNVDDAYGAYGLYFYGADFGRYWSGRYCGLSVRPVSEYLNQNGDGGEDTEQAESSLPTGPINGHGYVDLGLSVKWATCNVGASSPSDYGNYYAWGETSTKSEYTEENSKTYGKSMGGIAGNPQYDAARANWGGTWRLPTASEIDELMDRCKWTSATQGGRNGCKVTGPNGNSIFLPAAGCRDGASLNGAGEGGGYWSATPNGDDAGDAYGLAFLSDGFCGSWNGRYYGVSVRPVSE